jgi:hypothetical protein
VTQQMMAAAATAAANSAERSDTVGAGESTAVALQLQEQMQEQPILGHNLYNKMHAAPPLSQSATLPPPPLLSAVTAAGSGRGFDEFALYPARFPYLPKACS